MSVPLDANLGGLVAAICLAFLVSRIRKSTRTLPLPPGPTPIPFIGNVIGLKPDTVWISYAEWGAIYGEIIYTTALTQRIVVINSERVANDLLEKRSRIYSDRLQMALVDVFGWGNLTSSMPYGPAWRKHRRLYNQVFHAQSALTYRPEQLQRAYEMVSHMLVHPKEFGDHLETYAAAVVMSVVYGYDIQPNDPFVDTARTSVDMVTSVATPEKSAIVSAFPFVLKLPMWLPGMGFMRDGMVCRKYTREMLDGPYEYVQKSLADGTAKPSMVSDAIQRYRIHETEDPEMVHNIKASSGTAYAVQTVSTIQVFLIAMMQNPEVQKRAHAEVDAVVGNTRLPSFSDRQSLPYVEALIRETRRWRPITPIGVPHATTEDDVYEGYYIPKGVAIIPNLWAMSRDEAKYPSPESFRPERFLGPDGNLTDDTVAWSFGFGRRICPGRHIADAAVWAAIVCILAVFRIEKPEGPEQEIKWKTGLTSLALPFKCSFISRKEGVDTEKLAELIAVSDTSR
ncbi:cytochrome P450 [Leucogyrophana mollusca]|uniref:Cytochrome P450 n=1 Tax=Leucogyrophana mollusca TaxID=85980 RepID=A0ACB8BTK5_9AGAM|nr:cytochrome P450 [Leucogyrophana mollusca]